MMDVEKIALQKDTQELLAWVYRKNLWVPGTKYQL
jgi:hypothetical protein